MHRCKAVIITIIAIAAACLYLPAAASPTWLTRPGTIVNAVAQPDGTTVYLDMVVVDKMEARHNPGYFVIQECWDAKSRIVVAVTPPQELRRHQFIDIQGVLGTLANGERAILNPHIYGYFTEDGKLLRYCPLVKGINAPTAWPYKNELFPASTGGTTEPVTDEISSSPLPAPKHHNSISDLLSTYHPGTLDGSGVKLSRKKVVGRGTDPVYGKYFVIEDDSASQSEIRVFSSDEVTVGSRVNDIVAQVQTQGDATVLSVDAGPGFDPQGYSGGAQPVAVGTIGFARTLPDGTPLSMQTKVVVADPRDFPGKVYVQEIDRSAAILVKYTGTTQFVRGGLVSVTGTLTTTTGGERAVDAGSTGITVVQASGIDIKPVAMNNKSLGGAAFNDITPGITSPGPASGLYNKGMLVKVYGCVTAVDMAAKAFYIDDGSGITNASGIAGVKVVWNTNGDAVSVPIVGQFLTNIVGISSSEEVATGEYSRVVLLRNIAVPVVTAATSSHKVELSWIPQPGVLYTIYRSNAANGTFTPLAKVSGGDYTDTTVLNGSVYYYKVTGTECSVEGAYSAAVMAAPMGSTASLELTSFDPVTGTYIYTVTLAADNTYNFGYLQVDTFAPNAGPNGPWTLEGPFVNGVDQAWPKGCIQWDTLNGGCSAIWDPISRGQIIPANTAWQGQFKLVVPNSEPVMGKAATKDGQPGSYKVHDVLVPSPKAVEPPSTVPPLTEIAFDGQAGTNDWFKSAVTVSLTATDPDGNDTIAITDYKLADDDWKEYTEPFQVTDDGMYIIQGRSEDIDGNVETPVEPKSIRTLKIDATAPVVTGVVATQPNAKGWYKTDVVINYSASDETSGLASPVDRDPRVSAAFTHKLSSEGSNLSDTGKATDKAGNEGACNVTGIKIDKTAPVINVTKYPIGNCHLISYETVLVRFTVTDNGSGIDGLPTVAADIVPVDGWADPLKNQPLIVKKVDGSANTYEATLGLGVPGQYTIKLKATDKAGNTAEYPTPILFGARGFEVEWLAPLANMDTYIMEDGSTLPVKFKLKDPAKNDAYVNRYQYTVKVYYNSPTEGKVLKGSYTPDYECLTHAYKVNIKTRDLLGCCRSDDWDPGDYTVVIVGPGIWDIVTGPYKSAYGVEIVDKGCAKGKGRRQDWDWDWFWHSCGGYVDWSSICDSRELWDRDDLYCRR